MIITTWIVYIFSRKGVGFPFPPKISSDVEVVESEAVSVVQHWLKKTEEEASQDIKEKMSTNGPPTHGQDVHVTRDVVKHHLSKSNLLANQSQEVLEERTRIQFIRWSHTRIFQVPSEVRDDVLRERIEQVRQRLMSFGVKEQPVSEECPSPLTCERHLGRENPVGEPFLVTVAALESFC
uniref:Spermatosis associated 19 n=1 Tax=Equus asinus TaxID=9793 RepID=A0A9L0J7Z1_EQUAS|nr:spermatogenesis-associated protein 19, mitochondrial isoform X1 [Equus asinus]